MKGSEEIEIPAASIPVTGEIATAFVHAAPTKPDHIGLLIG